MLLADHCNSASGRALFGVFVNDTDSLRRWWDVATSASVSFKILLLSTQFTCPGNVECQNNQNRVELRN